MKYTIQIEYHTGDSFRSYEETRNVEASWENLDIAKENLQRIKEHYQYYKDADKDHSPIPEYSKDQKEWGRYKSKQFFKDLKEAAEQKPWWHKGRPHYDFCIMLKADDGTEFVYHTFWCGYFEYLNSAEIIVEPHEDSDMKITF